MSSLPARNISTGPGAEGDKPHYTERLLEWLRPGRLKPPPFVPPRVRRWPKVRAAVHDWLLQPPAPPRTRLSIVLGSTQLLIAATLTAAIPMILAGPYHGNGASAAAAAAGAFFLAMAFLRAAWRRLQM
jgi:hypothetical protein